MKKPNETEIANLMAKLGISREEAIDLWLCDNGEEENEEQNALDKSASKVKIDHDCGNKNKGQKRVVTRKVSDEKAELFNILLECLANAYNAGASIEKDKQSIAVAVGDKRFTVNVVEHRPPKVK